VPWLWISCAALAAVVAVGLTGLWAHLRIKRNYLEYLVRIFQERPLFIIPRGQPVEDAEDISCRTEDGLTLQGCYLPARTPRRAGVILFGLEFGSNRWACVPYTDFLREVGYDVCTFEPRNQGDSDAQPGYEPLQWVTEFDLRDTRAALAYLKGRADADPRGVGFFGISKGGSAGVLAGARDPFVGCFVTDGIFATHTTMVPYMRKWITIYSSRYVIQKLLPRWYYAFFANIGLRQVERDRGVRFPHLEWELPRLAPRPLLMIHGEGDTYIKPDMAEALFARARRPKEFWLVEKAKHNQAFHLAGDEYRRRVREFFLAHLPPTPGPLDRELAKGVPQTATVTA
jgi:uncharacterized protein